MKHGKPQNKLGVHDALLTDFSRKRGEWKEN
jgi:hypothetical protein